MNDFAPGYAAERRASRASRPNWFASTVLAVTCAAAALTLGAAASSTAAAAEPRVVAIGDIHGAFDAFVANLTRVGLIDARRQWSGGKTVFVQTGDYTDRGEGERAVMDLLMALEGQAQSA